MKYIITEKQNMKLRESIGMKDVDLLRYIKSLLNKEETSYQQSPQATPELKDEMDRILKMIFKFVKGKLNLKVVKDVEISRININYSDGVQEITNVVYPISFSWVDEKGEKYALEYEELKKAFYNFEKIMGIGVPSEDSKRIVKFRFQWDMSHRIKK